MQDQSYKLSRLNPTTGTEWINYQPGQRKINSSVYLEAKAEYTRLFHDIHTVNALFVYTMRNQKSGIADNLQLSLPYRNIGLACRMATTSTLVISGNLLSVTTDRNVFRRITVGDSSLPVHWGGWFPMKSFSNH